MPYAKRSQTLRRLLIMLVAILVGVWHFATIRDGHDWGDDFSQYLAHAKNLAEGRPYHATGYIYNPASADLGPPTYPPIFPALLAPLQAHYGTNLCIFKRAIVVMFTLWLLLFGLTFERAMPTHYFIATLLILGLNPFFWEFKDRILSDIPFALFTYVTLFLMDRFRHPVSWTTIHYAHALAVGLCMSVAYGTRSVGIVLLPCLFAHEYWHQKRFTRFAGIAALVFSLCWGALQYFLHDDSGYIVQLSSAWRIVASNIFWIYPRQMCLLWDNGYSPILRWMLGILISSWFLFGWIRHLKRELSIFDIFLIIYWIPILIWPANQGNRFLIPILPIYVFHAVGGIVQASSHLRHRSVLIGLVFCLIAVAYIAKYSTQEWRVISEGIADANTQHLFAFVRAQATERDVWIFFKPRAFAFFTNSRASASPFALDDAAFWDYARQIGATYLILSRHEQKWQQPFPAQEAAMLSFIYANADFRVYQFNHPIMNSAPFSNDTP